MPNIERKIVGVIIIERETQKERANVLSEADGQRVEAALEYKRVPSATNGEKYYEWDMRLLALLNSPLTIKVRLLGMSVPLIGTFLETEYFESTTFQSHVEEAS